MRVLEITGDAMPSPLFLKQQTTHTNGWFRLDGKGTIREIRLFHRSIHQGKIMAEIRKRKDENFGSLAIMHLMTHGFASCPREQFAIIGSQRSWVQQLVLQQVFIRFILDR